LRDEAHHALNSKHHDGSHHATKSEPTHLDMTNVFEQSATKAVQGTSKAVGQVVAGAWKASGDEANHLWNAMDSNAATHFYKHDLCSRRPHCSCSRWRCHWPRFGDRTYRRRIGSAAFGNRCLRSFHERACSSWRLRHLAQAMTVSSDSPRRRVLCVRRRAVLGWSRLH
jgi:hypothetical protein